MRYGSHITTLLLIVAIMFPAACTSDLRSGDSVDMGSDLATANRTARDRLQQLGYDDVRVREADGYFGWEDTHLSTRSLAPIRFVPFTRDE